MKDALNHLSSLLDVPDRDPNTARRQRLLTIMLVAVAASALLMLPVLLITAKLGIAGESLEVDLMAVGLGVVLLGVAGLYILNRRGNSGLAAALFILLLIVVAAFSDTPRQVVDGRGLLVFTLPILAASVLLHPWAGFIAAGLCALVITFISQVFVGQAVPNLPAMLSLFVVALIAWLSARSLERALADLRTTNDHLQESEAQYRGIVNASSDALIVVDRTGTIVEANPAARELYGYAPGELKGAAMTALIHPDNHVRFTDLMNRIPEETELSTEAVHIHQDGTTFNVDMRLSTFDYVGRPHTLTIVRDISERKHMERTMQERMKELTCLYGLSRDVQEDLSVEALCQRIVRRLGPAMKFPEIAVPVIVLDGDRFGLGILDGKAVRTLHADIKVRGVTRGQVSVTYVEDQPFVIPEEQNLLNSVAEILGQRLLRRQIEYQREVAHDALEEQLTRVELLNQIARAMAARYDLDSILRVVTQRLEDGFTDQASVWLREDDRDTFTLASTGDQSRHAAKRSGLPPQMVLPENTGRSLIQGELRYWPDIAAIDTPRDIAALIEHLDVHAVVMAPLAAGGEVLGVLATARRRPDAFKRRERDFLRNLAVHVGLILRQAQLRHEIQAAYDDLRQTQQAVMQQERLKALRQMASGIAHDINNAIAPLPLYASMLKGEPGLSPDAQARLDAIETAIGDVEETVARMRQFYRRPEETEALAPVDVNALVNQAIDLTQPRWRDTPQEHGITIDLQTDLQDDQPPVMGIEGEIRQAVVNLIFNAVDAMPEGGTLTLKTRERTTPPRHVVLNVIDTGVGMDAETRKHCLEPFYSTKGEEGSGLGLATVFGTMQRHEGDVNVASAPGEGTTVQLRFPVRAMDQDVTEAGSVTPPPPLRILCIDDEPLLRQALQETLEREGHTVALADGGKSGLAAFHAARKRGSPFDVVITDLGMPYVDGREVARTVKAASPSTPVILLTGWGVSLDEERDVPDAVDLVLGKPPMLDALNRALARVAAFPSDSP